MNDDSATNQNSTENLGNTPSTPITYYAFINSDLMAHNNVGGWGLIIVDHLDHKVLSKAGLDVKTNHFGLKLSACAEAAWWAFENNAHCTIITNDRYLNMQFKKLNREVGDSGSYTKHHELWSEIDRNEKMVSMELHTGGDRGFLYEAYVLANKAIFKSFKDKRHPLRKPNENNLWNPPTRAHVNPVGDQGSLRRGC